LGQNNELNMVPDMPGIHHTIAADGEPVRAGGQISFRDGRVTSFDNKTGHYKPTPDCADAFIERGIDAFARAGVGIRRSVITTYSGGW
jgi:hypothetical protein